jgi:hypothetical protein
MTDEKSIEERVAALEDALGRLIEVVTAAVAALTGDPE